MALTAAGVFATLAILESPRLPLAGLVVGLGGLGGVVCVRAPARTPLARRQFVRGALVVAGTVLVVIGVGHHLNLGLAVVGLLASCSPWTLRWITGS
ncbi:MAG TPA: hypothetical protein PLZ93_08840 [Nocardioides sp.]|nr:hypothetical protein [Nocardioides sp.]HRD62684.1 hypothetical protein [Nocardioides sp.]HRI95706.1 hypothetical protein [Nocardioides sp.]HRK46412.1 hypothetical protein [Nocardioides sp.]